MTCAGRALRLAILALALAAPAGGAASSYKPCGRSIEQPGFATYWLGARAGDLPLEGSDYLCGNASAGEGTRTNTAEYRYGTCEPAPCQYPLVVQTSTACDRHYGMYDLSPPGGPPERPPLTTVRGVPAMWVGETRLELYTGDVTAVIFGRSRQETEAAARDLRPAGQAEPDGAPLPPPVRGHLAGTLDCGLRLRGRPRVSRRRCSRRVRAGCRRVRIRFPVRGAARLMIDLRRARDCRPLRHVRPWPFDFADSCGTSTYAYRLTRGRTRELVLPPGRYTGRGYAFTRSGRHTTRRTVRFTVPRQSQDAR